MEVLSGCLFHCTYRPHFVYPTVYRHLSISTLALLQIMLLPQSLVYRYLFESLLSILLGIYLAAEFLGHKVILCLTFWDAVIPFSAVTVPFYVPDSSAWRFQFPCFLTNTCEPLPTPQPPSFFDNNHPNGCELRELYPHLYLYQPIREAPF